MALITVDDIAGMDKFYRTTLINSLPGYKGLHLLGTTDPYGNTNLGLFNSVFHVGANPPLLGVVLRPDTPEHDTLSNIQATGSYTLNSVLSRFYKAAHQTSASYPSGISEFEKCGFTPQYIKGFKAPFVLESPVRIGLELRKLIDLPINGTTIVIGEITHILLEEQIVQPDGYVDHVRAGTVAVAGLDSYFTTEPLGRLAYAKADRPVSELTDTSGKH